MNTYNQAPTLIKAFSLLALLGLSGCAEFNDPYPSSNYDPYYNSGYNNDDYYRRERDRASNERHRLERERDRLEDERERLERERERQNYRPPPPPPRRESCPSGFSPSEQKCSKEERRRGCQDIRLPGGLGCVRR